MTVHTFVRFSSSCTSSKESVSMHRSQSNTLAIDKYYCRSYILTCHCKFLCISNLFYGLINNKVLLDYTLLCINFYIHWKLSYDIKFAKQEYFCLFYWIIYKNIAIFRQQCVLTSFTGFSLRNNILGSCISTILTRKASW